LPINSFRYFKKRFTEGIYFSSSIYIKLYCNVMGSMYVYVVQIVLNDGKM